MVRIRARWALTALLGLVLLGGMPGQVRAEWPPFSLSLTATTDARQISYTLRLDGSDDLTMVDMAVTVPLPAGTRLIEAKSDYPGVEVSSDGKEVAFVAAVVHRGLQGLHLTVEITDPHLKVFTTHAYAAWKGDPPGTYLGREVNVDLSNPAVNWRAPEAFLSLAFHAVSDADTVTYSIRPMNVGWLRMWDLKIDVPLPENATLTGYEAPLGFVPASDGQTVSFSTVELPQAAWVNPLRLKISAEALDQPVAATQASATWKNVGWGVPDQIPAEDRLDSGYLVLYPHANQLVVAGMVGNVPFEHYDLTSVAFLPQQADLLVVFYTIGDVPGSGDTVEFDLLIDGDCRAETGAPVAENRGADFRAVYDSQYRDAGVELWDAKSAAWKRVASIQGDSPTGAHTTSIWIPYRLLPSQTGMCWVAQANTWNRGGYKPYPPADEILSEEETRLPLPQWQGQWGNLTR